MNEPSTKRIETGPFAGMTLTEARSASHQVTLTIDAYTYIAAQLVAHKVNLTTDDILLRWIAIGGMHDVLKQHLPPVTELDGVDVINDLRCEASQ